VGEAVISRFDHADLNRDPLFPPGTIPTTENLVRAIWELLVPKLGAERLHRLRLWEDPTFSVEYLGQ
jgi:6-pyruvoyl-tetrahydropterin synthase